MEKNSQRMVLKGLTLSELREYFLKSGDQRFRGQQLFNWMYNHLVVDFDEMTSVPKILRNKLKETTEIITLKLTDTEKSSFNDTKKYIVETKEGYKIESVVIPEENRTTLCVSTQVGCPLDCKFCATGLMEYKKNLSAGEIFDQYLLTARDYGVDKITNI
ncbi:MAG: 23S rRNA (adenine(2503)-C(2))-methyltransferase RlmN, partial [Candidatus Lokiarchaeota archaeon]